jgi:hypothetical protein
MWSGKETLNLVKQSNIINIIPIAKPIDRDGTILVFGCGKPRHFIIISALDPTFVVLESIFLKLVCRFNSPVHSALLYFCDLSLIAYLHGGDHRINPDQRPHSPMGYWSKDIGKEI